MKGNLRPVMAVVLTVILFTLPSCSKVVNYIDSHQDELVTCCQIQTITNRASYNLGYDDLQQIKITYNASGDPVKILAEVPQYSPFDYLYHDAYFLYDRQHRLTDYMLTTPGSPDVTPWEKYSYPEPGIVIDSTIYFGDIRYGAQIDPTTILYVTKITLDAEGRPIKYWRKNYLFSDKVDSSEVRYDAKGNKIVSGVSYDDKVNIYRTNKIWQFVFGDYSRNNAYKPATATNPASISSYNRYGLPLVYTSANFLFGYPSDYVEINYSCDSSKIPQPAY